MTVGTAQVRANAEYDGTAENFVGAKTASSSIWKYVYYASGYRKSVTCPIITNGNQILDDFTLSKPGATPHQQERRYVLKDSIMTIH